ncbi:hypothetical protein SAMN05216436_12095 [bacterium A37T11]|nr:hypothetical protein SAMN05216436_12095 [bacterium A37T11]
MDRSLKKIIFFFSLVLFSFQGRSQVLSVSVKLDTATIKLGDQTILRLSATVKPNSSVQFPALADTVSSKIAIVDIAKPDTLKSDPEKWVITHAYTITSFDAGVQTVPSFAFGNKDSVWHTDPMPLQVNAVSVDTTKAIYDIKQPLGVSYTWVDWLKDHWYWLVLGMVVILLVIGLWWYFKKRKKPEKVVVEVQPDIPAHVLALDKLEALRQQKLWQDGQVKLYHSELSDIIREFLEKRYQIPAMEQTTDEIFSGLRHLDIPDQNRNRLRQILKLADLVKFAKEKPLNTDNEQSIENAMAFVREAAQ